MQQPSNDDDFEDISEDDFLNSLEEDDFVFVLNGQGELKTMVLPEQFDNEHVPENIVNVLRVFGLNSIAPATLH